MTIERRESGIASHVAALKQPRKTPRRAIGRVEPPEPVRRGPGRPPGKKSDPAFRQHSVWLRRTTHQAAMTHLRAADPYGADFSELVETLVAEWNSRQK